jgi:hypothetical protein
LRTAVFCPFTAGTVLWQSQSGTWTLSVCVRGTFSLVHGREAVLADAQEPVAADRYVDDAPRRGLYAPSDLVPYKPRVDVMLVGSAFAPHQQPVEALVARLSLGDLDKSLGVIGDRTWIDGPDGPEPSPPRPFRAMPLGDERAARARDNPHGFDLTQPPAIGAPALPNLEAADDEIGAGRTVGFGPVAPGAGARRGLLRPEGWAWVESGGRGPAPEGFDFGFYNAAPRDQQIDVLRAGDALRLANLSREHPHLETRLPDVRAKAFLVAGDMEKGVEIPLRCDTVWIDTERAVVVLSWRGVLGVEGPDEEALGTLVVAAESKGQEVGYAQIAKLLRDGGALTSTDGDTFTAARPLAAKLELPAEIDPDMMPTPGPMRAKRPRATTEASAEIIAEDSTEMPSPTAKLPAATKQIVVFQPGESAPPPGWEELTGSDLLELPPPEELKTLTRIDVRSLDDGLGDDPSTRPLLVRPPTPAALAAGDYARIAVATERGDAARALFQYGLGLPDLPRLQRECSARNATDPVFAQAFMQAVTEARAR